MDFRASPSDTSMQLLSSFGTIKKTDVLFQGDLCMMLPLPHGEFRAYIFDCDGTIADSMPIHYLAWKKALEEWNCPFPEEQFYAWGGRPIREILESLAEIHQIKMPIDEVAKHKEEYYYDYLTDLKAIPEVVEHIEASYGKIPFAVASGSRRKSVENALRKLNLLDKFETLVCAEDYAKGKPAPDCFFAAERLGVEPQYCLVFEDTALGIEAATAAGMASVLVPGPETR